MDIYQIFTQFIIFLFGATAAIDIIGYWPTIKDLYIYKKNSANKRSFALWHLLLESHVCMVYLYCKIIYIL